jgi:hypothetical protein
MAEGGEAFAHASWDERTETMREMQLSPLLSPASSIQFTVSTYSEATVSTATDWKRVV